MEEDAIWPARLGDEVAMGVGHHERVRALERSQHALAERGAGLDVVIVRAPVRVRRVLDHVRYCFLDPDLPRVSQLNQAGEPASAAPTPAPAPFTVRVAKSSGLNGVGAPRASSRS